MWILFAAGSSFFAGITAILAKCGIRKTDSDVATAIRTVVVLLFAWLMVLVTGAWTADTYISGKTLLFLVLSGILAVLFQGAAERGYQQGRSHRQIKHRAHDSACPYIPT